MIAPRAWIIVLLLALLTAGCGGPSPGPRPTPEGQTGPGEPDASGIPQPPKTGGR